MTMSWPSRARISWPLRIMGGGSPWPGSSLHPHARADLFELALLAPRPPRKAHLAAVLDQPVAEPDPFLFRHERHQVALDLHGVGVPRQPQALAQPPHVGVDDHAR